MIVATGTDLRAALDAVKQQGGGEIVLEKRTYTVPGGYTTHLPPGTSIRGEHGASRIEVVGRGDFTLGDGTHELMDFRIDGVQIVAAGRRDGWALRLRKAVRAVLRDVTVDPVQVGWRNQYGIWVDGFDDVTLDNVTANAWSKSLLMNGRRGQGWGADLYVVNGCKFTTFRQVEHSAGEAAVHIAGSCGGVYLESGDIIYSDVDVLINTDLTGEPNREIFLGPGLYLDSAGSDCLRVGPRACSTLHVVGTWIASGGLTSGGFPNGNGVNVHHDNPQLVGTISGARVFNHKGTGIALSGGRWGIGGMSAIYSNGGYGIHRPNTAASVKVGEVLAFANAKGDVHGT